MNMNMQASVSSKNGKVLSRKMASDTELMDRMGEAYDKACRLLHDKNQPEFLQKLVARRAVELAEQVIVAQIIEVAATGERDSNEICKKALQTLGLPA